MILLTLHPRRSISALPWTNSTRQSAKSVGMRPCSPRIAIACCVATSRRAGTAVTLRRALHVDGTLIEAWAGQKSFQRRPEDEPPTCNDGGSNPTVNFRGEKRSNATHQSTTDPRLPHFAHNPNSVPIALALVAWPASCDTLEFGSRDD